MKNLLVTKFKGKFQVNSGTDDYADRVIRAEVETFLAGAPNDSGQPLTEQSLLQLDRRLTDLLSGR
jgi:hypothetical protein